MYSKHNKDTDFWQTCDTQIDQTWVAVEVKEGVIVSPEGLVNQLQTEDRKRQSSLNALDRKTAELEGEIYTLDGTDYKVSFTSRDQSGLLAVKTGFEDFKVKKTIFDFQNGTVMPMSPDMFYDFSLWWVKKRNSFFTDRV